MHQVKHVAFVLSVARPRDAGEWETGNRKEVTSVAIILHVLLFKRLGLRATGLVTLTKAATTPATATAPD